MAKERTDDDGPEDLADEQSLIRRLTSKDVALKKALKKYTAFVNLIQNPNSTYEQCSIALRGLEKELSAFEFSSLSKNRLIFEANDQQTEKYRRTIENKEVEISSMQQEIENLNDQLSHEKRRRKDIEQYDIIADSILSLPPRLETISEISKLNEELEILNQEVQQTESRLELKKKQFQLLLYSIQQLQVIDDDEKSQKNSSLLSSTNPPTPISSSSVPPSSSSQTSVTNESQIPTETEDIDMNEATPV